MKQLITTAIILNRTDYGEADRIITVLTPDFGKLSLMAKGVRRVKSKLAGGIELFSVSEITFIKGRGEVGTLVSTRLLKYYQQIVKDLNHTMLGYELIRRLNKVTEDQTEEEYFDLLRNTFEALDDNTITLDLIRFWFAAQLLRLSGHTPNLLTDTNGDKLVQDMRYDFVIDNMAFVLRQDGGKYSTDHIKLLRLAFADNMARNLANVQGSETLLGLCWPFVSELENFS